MDINGTRFHLISGKNDWSRCLEAGKSSPWVNAAWDQGSLTLKPLLSIFPRGRRDAPLTAEVRRGAGVDRFGNWYWISQDEQRIYWQPSGTGRAQLYWDQTSPEAEKSAGSFRPVIPAQTAPSKLSGLAITSHHYLVVGNITRQGFYVFDLHAGGTPMLLLFPPHMPFTPFDIAPAPGGGVWILDRDRKVYWGLDRGFNILGEAGALSPLEDAPDSPAFHPVDGGAVVIPGRAFSMGFPLAAEHPVSIEALPDGSVLILDSPDPGLGDTSRLLHYSLANLISEPIELRDEVEVSTQGDERTVHLLAMVAHDIAYTAQDQTLYAIERDGNQAVAFKLDLQSATPGLHALRDYLPMHFSGGRALVASPTSAEKPQAAVYYDVVGRGTQRDEATHWVALHVIDQPLYARQAVIVSEPMDGKERDCLWHRLLLDACIPPETAVSVWTRAHNDLELLQTVAFQPEPGLYLRGDEAEIPFFRPFGRADAPAAGQGTWELLFQEAQGRYLQIELVLTGNGRVTPQLTNLRAYYPRFSYPKNYLPAVYHESGSFLERLLANMEGTYAKLEGQIAGVSQLFDARSAPPEVLDWLAGWLGLLMDPLWEEVQKQRGEELTGYAQPPDRRRLFIRYARVLYERRGTLDGLRFALHLFLNPCLECLLHSFKLAAINPASTIPQRLSRYDLATPLPSMSESELEDLLYAYVLQQPSEIRIVERFQTRGGRGLVAGDPTLADGSPTAADAAIRSNAHRFTVLTPEGLPPEEEAMVRRIINLEKPAHTACELRHYWSGFRVGEARLGIDSTITDSGRYVPVILGRDYLAEAYLSAPPPFDVGDRFVSDRDPLGKIPPL